MRFAIFALAALGCLEAQPKFPGTYIVVGYAEPGTHTASKLVPRDAHALSMILREDGSVTLHGVSESASEGEYSVNAADHTAIIRDGADVMFARFSHDTLVTRVPGGGPAFYWVRTSQ